MLPLIFLYSCKQDETIIGSDIYEADSFNVKKYVDTDIEAYTIFDDSLRTSGYGTVFGFYKDNVFGSVNAEIYTQMSLRAANVDLSAVTFDSLTLNLQIAGIYSQLSSSKSQKIYLEVHQLSNLLRADSSYYSTNSISCNPSPLFEGEVILSMDSVESNGKKLAPHISVRLKDEFMNLLKDNFTNEVAFVEKIKGLRLRIDPARSDNAIAYLDLRLDSTLSGVKLFYKENPNTDTVKIHTFSLGSGSLKFSKFEQNYSGTALSTFTTNPKDSIAKSPYLYLQSMGGTMIRMKFPSLDDAVRSFPKNVIINEASLILPLADINPNENPPPSQLVCWMYKADGTLGNILDLTGNYFDGTYDPIKKQYRMRLTKHIQSLLYGTIKDWGIVVFINGRISTANRCVIDGNNVKLEIHYSEQ